jgi:heat shock transcription factor
VPPPLDLDQIFNSGDYFSDFPELDKSGVATGYNPENQSTQTDQQSENNKDNNASGTYPATSQANDLFDFDSLQDDSVGDVFGQTKPTTTTTASQQRPVTGYFDNIDMLPGFDPSTAGGVPAGMNFGGAKNPMGTAKDPVDIGRILETFSNEGSPTSASVDDNVQTGDSGNMSPPSTHNPAAKRRKRT